jgi:ribosomal protein S27AE
MAKRLCLACGGELVMAFRPSEIGRFGPSDGSLANSNAKWRCGTCGQAFTAEQLRANKRVTSKVVGQA